MSDHRSSGSDDAGDEPSEHRTGRPDLDDAQRRRLMGALAAASAYSVTGCLGIIEGSHGRQGAHTPVGNGTSGENSPGEATDTTAASESFEVEYVKQGETLSVPASKPLLDAGLDKGWDLPYECRQGFCGECTAKVDGDGTECVDHSTNEFLSEDQLQAGFVLTCTGKPCRNLSVETGMKEAAESFTPAGQTPTESPTPAGESYDIEYVKQGETISVASNEPLLDAGLDEGWDLPYQCRHGICGECTAKVDGDGTELVEHSTNEFLSEDQLKDGFVLTCTGEPRSEFSLETDMKEEAENAGG